jgi:hypothetical protein
MRAEQHIRWQSAEAPDPRSAAVLEAEVRVVPGEDDARASAIVDVLAPDRALAAIAVTLVLRDGAGVPVRVLQLRGKRFHPGERRELHGLATVPLGVPVASMVAYLSEVTEDRVAADLSWVDLDVEGAQHLVQVWCAFDNPSAPPSAARVELVWEQADGTPISETTVPLTELACGPQVHEVQAHIVIPPRATRLGLRGTVVLETATNSGPYDLHDWLPELEDEGPRGALRGDGTIDAPPPPLRERIEAPPQRELIPAPADLRARRDKIASPPQRALIPAPADLRAMRDEALARRDAEIPEEDRPPVLDLPPTPIPPPLERPEPVAPEPGPPSLEDLVLAGNLDEALERVDAEGLEGGDRQQVSNLLDAAQTATIIGGCQLAVRAGWKGISTRIRRLLSHDEPAVRVAAAEALGALGGRSMVPALRRLLDDPDADVAGAAQAAISQLMEG